MFKCTDSYPEIGKLCIVFEETQLSSASIPTVRLAQLKKDGDFLFWADKNGGFNGPAGKEHDKYKWWIYSPDKTSDEKGRIFRILLDEIKGQQLSRKQWEDHQHCNPHATQQEKDKFEAFKREQVGGFNLQESALLVFGRRAFGYSKEMLQEMASKA